VPIIEVGIFPRVALETREKQEGNEKLEEATEIRLWYWVPEILRPGVKQTEREALSSAKI
jgi:hypothetical protein